MDRNLRNTNLDQFEYATVVGENKILRASFSWMALAMLLTSVTAYLFGFMPQFTGLLQTTTELGTKPTMLAYVVMFLPFVLVMVMSFALNRLSLPVLIALFVSFAVLNGISFSSIFMVYKMGSITTVFFSTAALFGIMAVAGYTTKTDLTKMGTLLFIGLIGIVIASVINMFAQSSGMEYVISILGVVIFTGLTAYDVQKIKLMGQEADGSAIAGKLGVMGALTLYLDFINLFLFLLRLFGGKKD